MSNNNLTDDDWAALVEMDRCIREKRMGTDNDVHAIAPAPAIVSPAREPEPAPALEPPIDFGSDDEDDDATSKRTHADAFGACDENEDDMRIKRPHSGKAVDPFASDDEDEDKAMDVAVDAEVTAPEGTDYYPFISCETHAMDVTKLPPNRLGDRFFQEPYYPGLLREAIERGVCRVDGTEKQQEEHKKCLLTLCDSYERRQPEAINGNIALNCMGCDNGALGTGRWRLKNPNVVKRGLARTSNITLPSLPHAVRNTIQKRCGYVNIDVKACHPSLLFHLMSHSSKYRREDVEFFRDWLDNRKRYFDEDIAELSPRAKVPSGKRTMSKDDIKKVYTAMCYGGSASGLLAEMQQGMVTVSVYNAETGRFDKKKVKRTPVFIDRKYKDTAGTERMARLQNTIAKILDNVYEANKDHSEKLLSLEDQKRRARKKKDRKGKADEELTDEEVDLQVKRGIMSTVLLCMEHYVVSRQVYEMVCGTEGLAWLSQADHEWDGASLRLRPGVDVDRVLDALNRGQADTGVEFACKEYEDTIEEEWVDKYFAQPWTPLDESDPRLVDREGLIQQLTDRADMTATVEETTVPKGDFSAAAKRVLDLYPGRVKLVQRSGGLETMVFDAATGLWRSNYPHLLAQMIHDVKDKLLYRKFKKDPEPRVYADTVGYGNDPMSVNKVAKAIELQTHLNISPEEADRMRDRSRRFLLFRDGVYDSVNDQFTPGFDTALAFANAVPMDYPAAERADPSPDAMRHRVFRTFFETPLDHDLATHLTGVLGAAVCGESQKRILWLIGVSNGGKSKMMQMLSKTLGETYGTIPAGALLHTGNNQTTDCSNLRWALAARYRRIQALVEMDESLPMNGRLLKSLSGGDSIQGRNHFESEKEFEPHFLTMIVGNNMSDIRPSDDAMVERIARIDFNKAATSDPIPDEHRHLFFEKVDPNELQKQIEDPAAQRGCMAMLLNAYQDWRRNGWSEKKNVPERIVAAVYKGSELKEYSPAKAFLEEFELTWSKGKETPELYQSPTGPKGFVTVSEVDEFARRKAGVSRKTLFASLKREADLRGKTIESKPIRVPFWTNGVRKTGQVESVWIGVDKIGV